MEMYMPLVRYKTNDNVSNRPGGTGLTMGMLLRGIEFKSCLEQINSKNEIKIMWHNSTCMFSCKHHLQNITYLVLKTYPLQSFSLHHHTSILHTNERTCT